MYHLWSKAMIHWWSLLGYCWLKTLGIQLYVFEQTPEEAKEKSIWSESVWELTYEVSFFVNWFLKWKISQINSWMPVHCIYVNTVQEPQRWDTMFVTEYSCVCSEEWQYLAPCACHSNPPAQKCVLIAILHVDIFSPQLHPHVYKPKSTPTEHVTAYIQQELYLMIVPMAMLRWKSIHQFTCLQG